MFLKLKASIDDGDRSPFGAFWFGPTPGRAGGLVSNDDALRLTAVYRAVRLLSDSLSVLPFRVVRRSADGRKFTELRNHWLFTLINRQPNPYMDPATFRKLAQTHLELRGNFYARIVANKRGAITALLPIHPDRVTVEMIDEYNWRWRITNRDGTVEYLSRTEVFHRRDFTLNGITGLNPIACAREALATGIAAQSYGQRFFENNAQPGGWIEYPGEFKTDQDRATFRDKLQALWGGRNQGKTAVLDRGMKYHEVAISNADAQFIESKKMTVSEIARLFGVPPHKLGDLSASTNNNIEQQSLDYINDSLMARIVGWESGMRFDLLGEDEQDLEIVLDVSALMRGDSTARRGFYHAGILDGWMTRNEARAMENLNPLPGLDEPLRPLNMVEESEAEDAEQDAETAEPPAEQKLDTVEPEDAAPPAAPGAARLEAMTASAIDRIARKETALRTKAGNNPSLLRLSYQKHAQFVADTLAVGIVDALDYCTWQYARLLDCDDEAAADRITRAQLAALAHVPE